MNRIIASLIICFTFSLTLTGQKNPFVIYRVIGEDTLYRDDSKLFVTNGEFGFQDLSMADDKIFDNFNKNLMIYGVSLSYGLRYTFGYISFHYQNKEKYQESDSVSYSLGGYQMGLDVFGKQFFKCNRRFDILMNIGAEYGQKNVVKDVLQARAMRQVNSFYGPTLTIEPRFFIRKLKIGFKFKGFYDFSDPKWVYKGGHKEDLPNYKAVGVSAMLSLCLSLIR